MNNSLISIIIPVYNAEKFISKCVESLIAQTYKNIEIILIDDCSTDVSYDIVRKYAEQDSRVKLYSTGVNGGPGKARNVGLENAQGEYIMFCDNDDTYEPNMCEVMLNTMIEKDVDLVTCKSNVINGKLDRDQEHYVNSNRVGYVDFQTEERFCMNVFVWNRIYKKSIIDKYDIKFTIISSEDDLFTFMYNSVISSYYGLNDKLYNLVLHKASYTQSIGKGKNKKIKWDKLYIIKYYIEFLEKYKLVEQMYNCLKLITKRELIYIFRYYKFSLFEYIKFVKLYNFIIKDVQKKNEMNFYNIYLKYKTPWFLIKMLKMCCWS